MPEVSFERPTSIRRSLVSCFFADSIQQIHSLRASGVISSHTANILGSDNKAFFKVLLANQEQGRVAPRLEGK